MCIDFCEVFRNELLAGNSSILACYRIKTKDQKGLSMKKKTKEVGNKKEHFYFSESHQ